MIIRRIPVIYALQTVGFGSVAAAWLIVALINPSCAWFPWLGVVLWGALAIAAGIVTVRRAIAKS